MDVAQIERLAMKGLAVEDLPERPNIIELAAYLAFRSLYKDFQSGRIDRDQAKKEKRAILDEYARGEMQHRYYVENVRRQLAIGGLLTQMAKSDCPRCRHAAAVLDGREKEVRDEHTSG